MSFNDLDTVILMLIAAHLKQHEPRIAQYATISRSWLSVVEALTFQHLRVDSDKRLRQVNHYLTSDRRAAFRRLDVTIHLPKYGEDSWTRLETESEKATNNQAFSDSLKTVFQVINSWSTSRPSSPLKTDRPQFTLEIQAISQSDYYHMDTQSQGRRAYKIESGCEMVRHESSFLDLVQELPLLPAVSELIIHGGAPRELRKLHPRYISAQAALRIVRACPCVTKFDLELWDMESKNLILRNHERSAFARGLGAISKTITHLKLHYPGVVPANHFFDPPIIPAVDGRDSLSSAINVLSQQLESLQLYAVVSEDLFDISSMPTHWPKLRDLRIEFDFVMPNGVWMIEQDPEDSEPEIDEDLDYDDLHNDRYDHEMPARFNWPEQYFRVAPNNDVFDGLHLAIAQALPRMPNLRSLRSSVDRGRAGCVCSFTSDGRENHKVLWRSCSTTTYEPHAEVITEWKKAFLQKSGQLEMQIIGTEENTTCDLVEEGGWPMF